MRGRIIARRRNAHEAANLKPRRVPAEGQKLISFLWRDPRLLRLVAGVDLDQQPRPAPLFLHFLFLTTGQQHTSQHKRQKADDPIFVLSYFCFRVSEKRICFLQG